MIWRLTKWWGWQKYRETPATTTIMGLFCCSSTSQGPAEGFRTYLLLSQKSRKRWMRRSAWYPRSTHQGKGWKMSNSTWRQFWKNYDTRTSFLTCRLSSHPKITNKLSYKKLSSTTPTSPKETEMIFRNCWEKHAWVWRFRRKLDWSWIRTVPTTKPSFGSRKKCYLEKAKWLRRKPRQILIRLFEERMITIRIK